MDYKHESFAFDEKFHFLLFQTSERQEKLHCHDCLELNLVEKGKGSYIIGGKVYPIQQGDIFVINNSERHLAIHEGEELTMTVVVFDTDTIFKNPYGKHYLQPFFQRKENFSNCIRENSTEYEGMRQAFTRMKEEFAKRRTGWQMVTEAAAQLLLSLLYRHYNEEQEIEEDSHSMQSKYGRIAKAFEFIDTHFDEAITLEQLAIETALSKTYLCKCFKEMTGQTVFGYVEQVRVQYACYLLQTTEKPISRIAMEAGFESVSYFNRMFKKQCGMPPGQFRKGK